MMLRFPRPAVFAAALLLVSPVPGQAQIETREGIALQNQIYELRQQIQALQAGGGSVLAGRAPAAAQPAGQPNDLLAQLLGRVDSLEEQVRQLRGRVDELQNQQQRQNADLGKRIDDLAFQVQGGHPAAAPAASASPDGADRIYPIPPSAAAPSSPPPAPVRRTPELALQEANAALGRRDYPAAEQAAREVISNNRTSPRAYDAQFVLAQSLYGQRQYSQAAVAYDDAYSRGVKGIHAPEALLGLSNALIAINEKKAACATLVKLHAEFPTLRGDLREAAATASQRGGCR